MRLLLPPSEAKNQGGRGRRLSSRSTSERLAEPRERALSALCELLTRPADEVAAALQLPPATVAHAIAANAQVRTAATRPALRRYSGVVYEGLASTGFSAAEQRVAGRVTLIFSGLFGVVRGDEPIPDYRVPAKARLPLLGVAGTFWRPFLDEALPAMLGRGMIVDLRSSDYAAMWRVPRELAGRVVTVQVLSPLPAGGWGVVSHPSKHAKGRLAGALIRRQVAGAPVADATDVAAAWLAAGGARAELDGPNRVVVYPV